MSRGQVCCGRLLVVLILLAFFNFADFLATWELVSVGPCLEWNPLMRALVGTPFFLLYKLVLIPSGLLFLWWARRKIRPRSFSLLLVTCGLYGVVTIRAWLLFYF